MKAVKILIAGMLISAIQVAGASQGSKPCAHANKGALTKRTQDQDKRIVASLLPYKRPNVRAGSVSATR